MFYPLESTFHLFDLQHPFPNPIDTPETRQSRKRSKSQQSRGSRGSRSNSMSKLNTSIPSQEQQQQQLQQPEYINISSLEDHSMTRNQSDLSVVVSSNHHQHPAELMQQKAEWNRRAIGPDAWYNDDFNFDRAQHSFADDPLLKQQYGQLLDMRYNQAGYLPPSGTGPSGPPAPQGPGTHPNAGSSNNQQLHPSTVQICHEAEMEHKPVVSSSTSRRDRSNTWHGDKFAEQLQIMERTNSKSVLLHVKNQAVKPPPTQPRRSLDSSTKENWSPTKAIDEIRKVKEAPPKNVVQDRRKKFEEGQSDEEILMSDVSNALEEAQKEVEDRQKKHSRIVSDFALSGDSKESSDGANSKGDSDESEPCESRLANQRKRSVLELLNDFEKKSQQLQEEEKKMVMKTSGTTGARRRVFSDTETMMYDTSSDENDSTFDPPSSKLVSKDQLEHLDAARKSSLPTLLPSKSMSEVQQESQYIHMSSSAPAQPPELHVEESQYLHMTPPMQRKPSSIASVSSMTSGNTNQQDQEQQRRPSQSVVLEHLIMEFGPERAQAIMDSFNKEEAEVAARQADSPNYQEIEDNHHDSTLNNDSQGHYEYLFKATSNDNESQQVSNYETVYQEIPEDQMPVPNHNPKPITNSMTRSPEMLPDIIGNAPAGRGNSSSDADDEGINKDQLSRSLFEVSDTFTPASFYLDKARKPSESSVPGSATNISVQSVVNKDRPSIGSVNSLSSRELPPTPTLEEQQRRSNSEDEARKEIHAINSQQPSQLKFQTHALLKQDINLTYQSVYENEDIGFTSSTGGSTDQLATRETDQQQQNQQKVPYYVADIKRNPDQQQTDQPLPERTLIKKRRAQTPDSFLLEQASQQQHQQKTPGPILNQDGVVRSKSLEGLLGDGPAGPRDSVQINMHYPNATVIPAPTPVVPPSPSVSSYRSTPLPARGHDPPPPPEGVPPLDLSSYWQQQKRPDNIDDGTADDDTWRESLRRASARVKQSPEHTLPPRLIPPGTSIPPGSPSLGPPSHQIPPQSMPHPGQQQPPQQVPHGLVVAHHTNGYVWDQREQRFYRLNDPTSPPNPRLFSRQPFLDQGLPNHTNSDLQNTESEQIKQLMQQQRPMSVGPSLGNHSSVSVSQQLAAASMMGRPNSTLPTSVNKNPSHFFNHNAQLQQALPSTTPAPTPAANSIAQSQQNQHQHLHQLNEHTISNDSGKARH